MTSLKRIGYKDFLTLKLPNQIYEKPSMDALKTFISWNWVQPKNTNHYIQDKLVQNPGAYGIYEYKLSINGNKIFQSNSYDLTWRHWALMTSRCIDYKDYLQANFQNMICFVSSNLMTSQIEKILLKLCFSQ